MGLVRRREDALSTEEQRQKELDYAIAEMLYAAGHVATVRRILDEDSEGGRVEYHISSAMNGALVSLFYPVSMGAEIVAHRAIAMLNRLDGR